MAGNRSLGSLVINLIAQTSGFIQGMDKAARVSEDRLKRIEASAKRAGVAIGAIGGAAATGIGIIVRNTMQAEKSLAQLDAILKSTGNAAGYTRDQLVEMARGFQQASTFGTNEIIEAQTRMLSYSGILGENIPRAMQSVIDQATRLGMSVSQSAETIGRALESPAKAAAALAQQGFGAAFTKEVRASIDALVAAGREGEAQIKILEILEESYGGAAEAARNTLGGALDALKHTLSDVLTGEDGSLDGLTQGVNDLIDAINDPKVRQGFAEMVSGALSLTRQIAELTPKLAELTNREMSKANEVGRSFRDTLFHLDQAGLSLKSSFESLLRLNVAGWFQSLTGYADNAANAVKAAFGIDLRPDFSNVRSGSSTQENQALTFGLNVPTPAEIRRREEEARRLLAGSGRNGERGGKARELPDFMKDSRDELQRLLETEARARAQFDAVAATLAGPMAEANYRYKQDLAELNELAKVGGIANEELAVAVANLTKAHETNVKAIQSQLTPAEEYIESLKEENAFLSANRDRQAWMTAARYAGADATHAQVKEAYELLKVNEQLAESMRNWGELNRNIADSLYDIVSGSKSAKDAIGDFLDNLNRQILSNITGDWADSITDFLKSFGKQSGGDTAFGFSSFSSGGGGFWSGLFGALGFAGGFADGGYVPPHRLAEINERGPEVRVHIDVSHFSITNPARIS